MSIIKPNTYPNSVAITISLGGLATTVADPPVGREGAEVDNSSNLYEDAILDGVIKTGTTPTVDKSITLCVWGAGHDGSTVRRPGGVTGADAGLTPTMKGAIGTLIRPALVIPTNATSDVDYKFAGISVCFALGLLVLPKFWGIFVFHDTAVNLNATGGNHAIRYTGINRQVV